MDNSFHTILCLDNNGSFGIACRGVSGVFGQRDPDVVGRAGRCWGADGRCGWRRWPPTRMLVGDERVSITWSRCFGSVGNDTGVVKYILRAETRFGEGIVWLFGAV